MQAATGEYILLLSSDVVIFEHGLADMLACLSGHPDAGIVGPMTQQATGSQQIGLDIERAMQDPVKFARTFRDRNRHRRIRCDRTGEFCMLFHRKLVQEIGMLDETLGDSGAEGNDFSIRASLAGYTSVIAGDVYVHRTGKPIGSLNMKQLDRKWPVTDIESEAGKRYLTLLAMEKGQRAFEKGDSQYGIDLFLDGIKLSPNSTLLYLRFAECLINDKRCEDALGVLSQMPAASGVLQRIELEAYANEGLENFTEAMRLVDRALDLDPDSAVALNLKGMLAHRQGEAKEAETYYRKAIERASGFGDPYTNLGALLWEDAPETALELLEKAFVLSPYSHDIAGNYHTAITSAECYSRAEPIFLEAAATYPFNKNLQYKTIDVLVKQEKFEAAMASIEAAIVRFGIDDGILEAALTVRDRLGADEITGAGHRKDTISLCMIVKNEEKDIGRCLHSVKPAVDEMIVVDTGSNDRTRDIAHAFGAKVYEMKWDEDFAAARNFAIEKAAGTWTFHLDADEVVARQDHDALRKLVRKANSSPRAYSYTTRNYTLDTNQVGWEANDGWYSQEEAGSGWTPSEKVRLFPRDDRIRFMYPVHELVEPSLKRYGIVMKKCQIPIHHYGKLNQQKSVEKKEAYYAIGRKKLAEMGDDAVALRELAIQAEILGRHREALELWERFLKVVPDDPQAYINMGIVHCRTGDFEALLGTAQKALELNPALKEAHYNYALAKLHLNGAGEAAAVLEKLLAEIGQYPPAHFLLAAAYSLTQRKAESIEVFNQLRKSAIGPDLTTRLRELAQGLVDNNRPEFALVLLETAKESGIQSREIEDAYSACLKASGSKHPVGDGGGKHTGGLSGQYVRVSSSKDLETGSRVTI